MRKHLNSYAILIDLLRMQYLTPIIILIRQRLLLLTCLKWLKGRIVFVDLPLKKNKATYILYIKYVYTEEGEKHGN